MSLEVLAHLKLDTQIKDMKKVAVILSGCGVYDGSEIHEAVLTLLALARAGCEVTCAAPISLRNTSSTT